MTQASARAQDRALWDRLLDPIRAPEARRHPPGAAVEAAAAQGLPRLRAGFSRHRLGPLWLASLEDPAALPAPLMSWLEAATQAALAQHVLQQAALARAGAALDRAGVDWVAFKGAHLSRALYPHPARRPAGDVDLLVVPEQLPAAEAALHAAGFAPLPRPERSHELSLQGHHADLDLHWVPLRPGRARFNPAPRIVAESVRASGVRVPSDAHALLLLLLHPAITDHVTGQLIRAVDLDRWVRTRPCPWDAVVAEARALGLGTAAWTMATWARRWLSTPVPPEVMQALAPGRTRQRYLNAWLDRDPLALYDRHPLAVRGGFSLALQDRPGDVLRAVGVLGRGRFRWRVKGG